MKTYLKITSLLLIAVMTSAQSSLGPVTHFCKDGWTLVDAQIQVSFRRFNVNRCVKLFETPASWQDAVNTCRQHQSQLVMADERINANLSTIFKSKLDFWSGMHVLHGRLQWDGTPPTVVQTSSSFRQWQWTPEGNEPNPNGKCGEMRLHQVLDFPNFPFFAKLENCSKTNPFVCINDPVPATLTNASYCPGGYYGNEKISKCYKGYFRPVEQEITRFTYSEAEEKCQADGGNIASFRNRYETIVLVLAFNTFASMSSFGFESPVWMKNSSLNVTNSDICNAYFPRMSQELTTIDLIQSERSCQERAPLLCEVNKRHLAYSVPQVEISYNRGNNRNPVANIPLICDIPRDLNTNETMVYEKDGEVVKSFNYDKLSNSNKNFRYDVPEVIETEGGGDDLSYIPNYVSRTALRYVGRYVCKVYANNTLEVYSSKAMDIRINESVLMIYRASMELHTGPTQNAYTIYNLYSGLTAKETTPITSGLTNTFSLMESKLPQSVLASQYFSRFHFSVDNIKFSGPGGTFVTFNVIGRPTNASWYTNDNERILMEEIRKLFLPSLLESQEQPLKRSISSLQTVYVRGSFSLQSTVACSGQVYHLESEYLLDFQNRRIGGYAVTTELCITDKKPLATAFCAGNGFTAAVLTNITINPLCKFQDISGTTITPTLKNLSEIVVTPDNVENVTDYTVNLTNPSNILTSIDVIYTAEILRNIATDVDNITEKVVQNVIDIVNNILDLDRNTLEESQNRGSAANRIIESVEQIAARVDLTSNMYRSLRNNLALEIWDVVDLNDPVVGIKLNSDGSINLQNNSLITLRETTGYNPEEVDAAIVLPESIYEKNNGSKRLVLQVYSTSKLFNTRKGNRRYSAQSRIVAAQLVIDGQTVHQFETKLVTTVFKPINVTQQDVDKLSCGYWNYTIYDTSGGWATDGCSLEEIKSGRYICVCNHLTNFAILLDFEGTPLPPEHKTALTIITIIGLSLSIAGLLFTVLTFIWFRQLRKGRSQQTLFNLALSMLFSWIIFLAGVERTESYAGCIVVAAFLHYFILVSFMWMLIEGILQYLRFVKVLGTYIPRFIFKAVLPAWGIPLVPVIIILAVNRHLYWGGNGYCWMSLTAFYYAFAIPVGMIILANIIVFIIVLYHLLTRPKIQSNQSERKIAMMNFRAALSVFVLLGLTWIFGYFAIADARIVFQYIFTILNVFQGLLIFILFTAREKQVRQQWARCCCCRKSSKSKYSDKTHSTGSNQPLKNSKTGTTDTHSHSLTDYNGTKRL